MDTSSSSCPALSSDMKCSTTTTSTNVKVGSPPAVTASVEGNSSSAALRETGADRGTSKEPSPALPTLPDDVWGKILFKAGTPVMLVLLRVNGQLRQVAKRLLRETTTLNLTRHFEQIDRNSGCAEDQYGRTQTSSMNSTMTEKSIINLIRAFPNLSSVMITSWRYQETRADIAHIICERNVLPSSVKRVELRGVNLVPADIAQLIDSCPQLESLCMGSHDSVDNSVVLALVFSLIPPSRIHRQEESGYGRGSLSNSLSTSNIREERRRRLDDLTIVQTRKVSDRAIGEVFRQRIAKRITLRELGNVRGLRISTFALDAVTITKCSSLLLVKIRCGLTESDGELPWPDIYPHDGDELTPENKRATDDGETCDAVDIVTGPELNFSQNASLGLVAFDVTPASSTLSGRRTGTNIPQVSRSKKYVNPPPMACTANSLNLSGCPHLCAVHMRRASEDYRTAGNNGDAEGDDFFDEERSVRCTLPFLTELNLFGARGLAQSTFTSSFGLASATSAQRMPLLRELVLNGTPIERLDLQGFQYLHSVNASGSMLREISIGQCPKLRTVALTGRRMPLSSVNLLLPPKCTVSSSPKRDWTWERYDTHQMIASS